MVSILKETERSIPVQSRICSTANQEEPSIIGYAVPPPTTHPAPFPFSSSIALSTPRRPKYPLKGNCGILASARAAYLAEDTCRHLASLCRMYNDLGSVGRDAQEASLNSVNFPEFLFHAGETMSTSMKHDTDKAELSWIAEYERRGLDVAMNLLEEELGGSKSVEALRLFINVTDL